MLKAMIVVEFLLVDLILTQRVFVTRSIMVECRHRDGSVRTGCLLAKVSGRIAGNFR